jgi:ABC-type branched-subunit amino acid transport system substrate-binding protein
MSIVGLVVAAYALVANGDLSVRTAFLLCGAMITANVAITLRAGLAPLRRLADAAVAMSEGQPLMVKSASPDDVGRITQALRSLQVSTQAAMSRMAGADTAHGVESTGAWPVVVIGRASSWAARGALAVAVLGIVASGFAVYSLAVPKRTAMASAPARPATEAPRLAAPATALPRGVTTDSITVGMSAPFSGGPRSLSEGMKLGIEVAFAEANAAGGVHGRQLKLVALDNGYDEKRAVDTTRDLIENRHVFGLIGSVGTPTVKAVLPYVNQNKVLLFGPLTGSPVTRNDPPDRYVFNVRASYQQETSQMVNYLIKVSHLPAKSIVVFAQNDSFGDAGYEGAVKTLRKLGFSGEPLRVGYDRNTVDVGEAAARVLTYNTANAKAGGVHAVIAVATATASAAFTARIASVGATVLNVSFVDASQLALEFHDHWPGVGAGVIVTQVVPHYDSSATGVIHYREALKLHAPDKSPGFASLEGYVVGALFAEGLRRAGPNVDTERAIDALEKIQDFDLGTGGAYSFGVSKHQASQHVWGTMLTAAGTFKPLDAEWME